MPSQFSSKKLKNVHDQRKLIEVWPNGVGERLRQEKDQILEIWEKRVRKELALANKKTEPELLNSLPEFLQQLTHALTQSSIANSTENKIGTTGEEHGVSRANSPYSLEQVLLEYRILREVVFAVLESEKILKPEKRDILLDSFQIAESRAASEFLRIKLFREKLELLKSESYVRSLKELQEVTEIAIAKSSDFHVLIRALLERIKAIFNCETVAIYLMSDDKKEVINCATYGFEKDVKEGLRFPVDQGVPGAILKQPDRPLIVEDLSKSGINVISPSLRSSGVCEILGITLRVDSNVIGAMHVGSIARHKFQEADIKLFTLIADRIAFAIYNSRLYEKSKEELTRFRTDDAVRARLLSLLAHEIRNPLTAAQMSAQLLVRKRDNPKVIGELSERVVDSIKRADFLVKDLLDVNRTLSGRKISIEVESCDLNTILVNAINTLSILEGDYFIYTPPEKPIQGLWSPSEMQRAIEQILKVCIRWNKSLAPVVISVQEAEQVVQIEIHTQGPVLPEAQLQTVSELLQSKGTFAESQENHSGTLELILAHGIVTTHGGEIKVHCSDALGIMFLIILPIE